MGPRRVLPARRDIGSSIRRLRLPRVRPLVGVVLRSSRLLTERRLQAARLCRTVRVLPRLALRRRWCRLTLSLRWGAPLWGTLPRPSA